MKELRALDKLLSDYEDLDQEKYKIIKNKIHQGLYLKVNPAIIKSALGPMSESRIPLITNALPGICFNIVSTDDLTKWKSQTSLRNKAQIMLMEDEELEIDIVLKDFNKRMGSRFLNFENIKYATSEVQPKLTMNKFFAYHLNNSNNIEVFLRIHKFSKLREEVEQRDNIFSSQDYYNFLLEDIDWNNRLVNLFLEKDSVDFLKERAKIWGYHNWNNQEITLNHLDYLSLEKLNIKNLNYLKDFLTNFFNLNITNEQLLDFTNAKKYEQRVQTLIHSIGETI